MSSAIHRGAKCQQSHASAVAPRVDIMNQTQMGGRKVAPARQAKVDRGGKAEKLSIESDTLYLLGTASATESETRTDGKVSLAFSQSVRHSGRAHSTPTHVAAAPLLPLSHISQLTGLHVLHVSFSSLSVTPSPQTEWLTVD